MISEMMSFLSPRGFWAFMYSLSERETDVALALAVGVLTLLVFVQLRIFSRPPPVPLKRLPRRPALSILFKPDDISATVNANSNSNAGDVSQNKSDTIPSRDATAYSSSVKIHRKISKDTPKKSNSNNDKKISSSIAGGFGGASTMMEDELDDNFGNDSASMHSGKSGMSTEASTVETPMLNLHDLPDSFAPLLSSSHTEVILQQLTADLLHAVQAEASVRVREGRHEIPLNKNLARPQLQLHSPKGGCRISAIATVGSDNLTLEEDLDVSRETPTRSKPMVKKAQLILDPPMPLANVAPTLIHIPTLFEDKKLPSLRRIQIVRMFMDFVISISSWLEKLLWIIESFCQIHLSNVQITPVYKGPKHPREVDNEEMTNYLTPDWRLTLAFSGHVLLFGFIPIPFISVVLPTFIIPQPHALISNLLSKNPLASAELKRENIAEKKVALAIVNSAESWNVDVKVVATPPALCLDVTLPGGGMFALIRF